MEIDKIKDKLKEKLDSKRYEHSLRVMEKALELAPYSREEIDLDKLSLSALLHDCGKLSLDKQIEKCKLYKVDSSDKREYPIIHQYLGYYIAREEYGIKDQDILMAIKYHTTARPRMSDLEILVYLADYLDPERRLIQQKIVEEYTKVNLKLGLKKAIEFSLDYLESKGAFVNKLTRETLEWLNENLEGEVDSMDKLQLIKDALEDKKAVDIMEIDLREKTSLTDYFIIASGNSRNQVKSIADGVAEKLEDFTKDNFIKEGYDQGRWVILDYGDIVVHIFHKDEREFYDLDRLWLDYKREE